MGDKILTCMGVLCSAMGECLLASCGLIVNYMDFCCKMCCEICGCVLKILNWLWITWINLRLYIYN